MVVDPVSKQYQFFGKRLGDKLVQRWRSGGKDQVICQAELIAIPIALTTWSQILTGRDVLVFIDNDPAREGLIRGSSVSVDSTNYIRACRLLCASIGAAPWYARVASPSNLSDLPSRGDFRLLLDSGATCVEPVAVVCEPDLVYLPF